MTNYVCIGEIQLHTIDNVLKNWTDPVGYWCCLATSELLFDKVGLLFVAFRKDQYYADKPETIDALKENIREPIGGIQSLSTKNWTDFVGYCMASRGSHFNEIIFHY